MHLVIGGEVAGGQLVALRLARAARERGHDVTFVSPSSGAFVELGARRRLPVDVVPLGGALDVPSLLRPRRAFDGARRRAAHARALRAQRRRAPRGAACRRARDRAHAHRERVPTRGSGRGTQVAARQRDRTTSAPRSSPSPTRRAPPHRPGLSRRSGSSRSTTGSSAGRRRWSRPAAGRPDRCSRSRDSPR